MQEAEKYKDLGNEYFKKGNYEEAINNYSKAIQLQPNQHVYYSNRAVAYINKENYELALFDSEKCIQIDQKFIKGYLRKGLALEKQGKIELAELAYKEGLQMDPDNKELLQSIERIKQPQQNNIQNLLSDPKFLELFQQNPQLFQQMMNSPEMMKNPEALKNMMNFFNKKQTNTQFTPQKEEEKKKEEPKQQQEKSQINEFENIKKQADQLYLNKKFNESIQKYNECISMEKNELIPYNNIAACFIELKEYQSAIDILQKAIDIYQETPFEKKKFENYAKILERMGRVYFLMNEYNLSIEFYKKSLLENNVSKVRVALKDVEREKAKQEQLKYINPELSNQHWEKGNENFRQGKFGEAIVEYEEAVKRDPKDIRNYTNLSSCFIKLMNFSEAKRYSEKALEIDPNNVKALLKQAQCFQMMKEYHKAIESYEKVIKLEPQNQEAKKGIEQTNLKINSEMKGMSDEERQKWAMADPQIQSIIQDPMVQIALQQMQQNPQNAMQYFQDATLGPKLQKLIQAGIIKTGQQKLKRIL